MSRARLTFEDFQERSKATAIYPVIHEELPLYAVLGLAGEAGEVCEKVKKILRDKGGELDYEDTMAIAKELGDCLWYISQIASDMGLSLEAIACTNLNKIANRQQSNTLSGSGDDRESAVYPIALDVYEEM